MKELDHIEQQARAHDVPPFLIDVWNAVVYWFLLPGQRMLESLAATPWGKDWGIPAEPHWTMVTLVALLFWAVLFSLLGAASAQIRNFLGRNQHRRKMVN